LYLEQDVAECYEGFIGHLKQVLESKEFLRRHRRREQDFTRERCLPFVVVILFLINMVKRALQDELDEFFKVLQQGKLAERTVTKSAFTQARRKLKHSAFIELNQEQVTYFYQHFQPLRWQGLRLLAVDGSMSELPNKPAIAEHFGVWRPRAGGSCPKARLSQLFDVLNKVTIDARIGPKAQGEREMARAHLPHLQADDLLLLDRGYPAFWLFAAILAQDAHFCARLTVSEWKVAQQLVASGEQESVVQLVPGWEAQKRCRALGLAHVPLTVRLLRIDLPTGEAEVLATSLQDSQRFPYAVFKELYPQRWPIEEDFKFMKSRLEIENWSGASVEAVYQDFHATVFTKNLAAILAQPAQQVVYQQSLSKKYRYHVNMTHLLSRLKDTLLSLFREPQLMTILLSLWRHMLKTVEPFRPGRSLPRQKRVKRKRYPFNYKSVR
jgi:hypothetical protein